MNRTFNDLMAFRSILETLQRALEQDRDTEHESEQLGLWVEHVFGAGFEWEALFGAPVGDGDYRVVGVLVTLWSGGPKFRLSVEEPGQ